MLTANADICTYHRGKIEGVGGEYVVSIIALHCVAGRTVTYAILYIFRTSFFLSTCSMNSRVVSMIIRYHFLCPTMRNGGVSTA